MFPIRYMNRFHINRRRLGYWGRNLSINHSQKNKRGHIKPLKSSKKINCFETESDKEQKLFNVFRAKYGNIFKQIFENFTIQSFFY